MFGQGSARGSSHVVASGFKGFVSAQNDDKTPDVLQGQLSSLVGTMASFDALGYSISDLTQVSKTLTEKEIFTIKGLVDATNLFSGDTPTWEATVEPSARSLAQFLQAHLWSWRAAIIQEGAESLRKHGKGRSRSSESASSRKSSKKHSKKEKKRRKKAKRGPSSSSTASSTASKRPRRTPLP